MSGKLLTTLFEDLDEICRRDVPLAPRTWFKLGGPAEYLVEPRTVDELADVLRRCHETGTPWRVLGLGANLLVGDDGVPGVVLQLSQGDFESFELRADGATVGAGVSMVQFVKMAVNRGLAGLEALAGIPGTFGGGIRMNCGGRFGDISTSIEMVRTVGPDGAVRERTREELQFDYRKCRLDGDIVASADLRLAPGDPVPLRRHYEEIWNYKFKSQPTLSVQSAGCIFRNPPGNSAGAMIDRAGLKGARVGGAVVSDRHANFIVAEPGCTAAHVLALIDHIRSRVFAHAGIPLETEVEIW